MRVVGLISGGKDSSFNLLHCVANGHTIVALANLYPPASASDELDSYAFQTVGHALIPLYATCMNMQLFRRPLHGRSVNLDMHYTETAGDETEDLYALLRDVKLQMPDVEAVSVGAILSDYQRIRVEQVCARLGLHVLAYMWRQPQPRLLHAMTSLDGFTAVIIKTASLGLLPSRHLCKTLSEMEPHLTSMANKYGLNVCGEGGEYETFTLDSPLFTHGRIEINEYKVVLDDAADVFAPVGYIGNVEACVREKAQETAGAMDVNDVWCLEEVMRDFSVPDFELAMACMEPEAEFIDTSSTAPEVMVCCVGYMFALAGISASPECIRGSIELETEACFALLQQHLDALGASMSDLVAVHVHATSIDDFARINAVYGRHFLSNPPIRVFVQVHALPGCARLSLDCTGSRQPRGSTMHVQSISYWAPANIGPYSQSCESGGLLFVAGQIGMMPPTLALPVCRSALTQAWFEAILSLKHVQSIVEASKQSAWSSLSIAQCVCFVTDPKWATLARTAWDHERIAAESPWEITSSDQVLVVQVPGLPKGALIEWHVVLRVHQGDLGSDRESLVAKSSESVSDALDAIHGGFARCSVGWSNVLTLRVFVTPRLGFAQVFNDAEAWFSSHGITRPSIVPVPVLWIDGDKLVAVCCVQLNSRQIS